MNDDRVDWQDGDLIVVVNDEEQYSIWPADRPPPAGWREAGYCGKKAECLDFIKRVWVDMRPLSLRQQLEQLPEEVGPLEAAADSDQDHRDLVGFLSEGQHPIEVVNRAGGAAEQELEASINRGFVLIKFTDTQGGTELGVRLDRDACKFASADFRARSGSVHLEGALTLDYTPVRCVADLRLETLQGTGYLAKS